MRPKGYVPLSQSESRGKMPPASCRGLTGGPKRVLEGYDGGFGSNVVGLAKI